MRSLLKERLDELVMRLRALPAELVAETRRLPARVRASGVSDWLNFASTALLLWISFAWFKSWYHGNDGALFDPYLQPDDARTAIFPFHRYAPGHPLADDPIANEMLEYQPYAYRLLFRVTVPFVGLLLATKLIAALLFLILLAAGIVLATSRRAGFAAGVLLVVAFVHDASVQDRILGGLPRGFGFPVCALWLSGALAGRPWVRRVAAVIGALTYPSGLAMVLGAEGIYALRGLGRIGRFTLLRRLKHYALLVAACAALLAPAVVLGMSKGGPIHTLEQAENEPAFSKAGRLRILPFPDPGREFGRVFQETFDQFGPSPTPGFRNFVGVHKAELAMAIAALLLALPLLRLTPLPTATLAFFVSSLILYALARGFAFKLYSPERYYTIGIRMVALGLIAGDFGLLAPRLAGRFRQPLRNVACTLAVAFIWFGLGDGVRDPQMGYDIDYRRDAPLWDFIRKLPLDARIACHINDCDSVPLFAQRANNGGFETLQPWLTLSWARQKARAQDTLHAIYATSPAEVFAFAAKYKVSHLLVNRNRYGDDFSARSRSFEPLSTYTRDFLRGRRRADLVLGTVPDEAIVFKYRQLDLVSVAELKRAWSAGGPTGSAHSAPAHAADEEPEQAPGSGE